jgi:vitamin B12 transporter
MKVFITSIMAMLLFITAQTQTVIKGTVLSTKGKPLSTVNVSIVNSYDGVATDVNGMFEFTTTETGTQKIEFTKVGFTTYNTQVSLSGNAITLNVSLKELRTEDNVVIISAGSFEAGDKKRGATLTSLDILTTGGANADISNALKTLPGTQQVGEAEGLFVRGGTAAETKVFIDGTPINNFFYTGSPDVASRGRFFPSIFKGTQFNTGGYSALYGQALSSALILESVDMPDKSEGNVGLSVLSLGGGFQKLAKNKKASFGINYGYTNLTLAFKVAKQKFDFTPIPTFHTLEANFRIKTSKTGFLKYYTSFNANKLGQGRQNLDSLSLNTVFNLTNIYNYHNLSYKENITKKWKLNIGTSIAFNMDDIKSSITNENDIALNISLPGYLRNSLFKLKNKAYYANAKLVLERKFTSFNAIRFGAEYNHANEQVNFTNADNSKFVEDVKEHLTSLFAETDVYISDNVAAKMGARMEHSKLLDDVNVAPRISLAYKFKDKSQFSLAYGIFYQNPERRYLPSITNITFMKSAQYIMQYLKTGKGRTFRSEVFYKKYNQLVKTTNNNVGQTKAVNNNGYGDASGIEFFYRDTKTIKNLDFWISYSYLNTKRDFLNYPTALQPTFAARNNGSLVLKKFVTKIMTGFNVSYTFSEGRPYYNPNKPTSDFLSDRTKPFHTIGFSCNWLPKLPFKNTFGVVVLSVNNVLGFNQQFGYNYSTIMHNGSYRSAEVTPASKRFFFLGFFLNFGVDNTQDIINNNL